MSSWQSRTRGAVLAFSLVHRAENRISRRSLISPNPSSTTRRVAQRKTSPVGQVESRDWDAIFRLKCSVASPENRWTLDFHALRFSRPAPEPLVDRGVVLQFGICAAQARPE
jgi:hypothetical protein